MSNVRLTLRARLTLVYGALFVAAGIVMLAVTWALVQQQFLLGGQGVVERAMDFPDTSPMTGVEPAESTGVPEDFVVGVVGAARDEALRALVTQGAVALVLVGGLAVWIGWLVAGRMLQPLSTITATARRIADAPDADRRMHERIHLTGPRDEIKDLAETFDGMLARLDTSFDAQRRFISNASHELRTPLAVNRALLEVAVQRQEASTDLKVLGDTLLEVNARHERLIDGLLLLARSERELPERRLVDLADIVEHVGDATVADAAAPGDARVPVRFDVEEAPTSGDPVLLEHLVRNLIENAVRHNLPEGGWASVVTRTDDEGHAVLEVRNSGPDIPPYDLDGLFVPFRRLSRARTGAAEGVGLGLSIVRSIVQAHGGSVTLTALPEGGLEVVVTLPGEPYDESPTRASEGERAVD